MRSYANAEREPDKPGAGLFKNVVNTGQSISGRLAAHYLGRVFVVTSFRHSQCSVPHLQWILCDHFHNTNC